LGKYVPYACSIPPIAAIGAPYPPPPIAAAPYPPAPIAAPPCAGFPAPHAKQLGFDANTLAPHAPHCQSPCTAAAFPTNRSTCSARVSSTARRALITLPFFPLMSQKPLPFVTFMDAPLKLEKKRVSLVCGDF
jgi:hypothetical protein